MKHLLILLILAVVFGCAGEERKPKAQPAPPMPTRTKEVLRDSDNAIQVRLNSGNTAMIDGVIVDSIEIKRQLRIAKKEKGDTATIVLHVRGDTEFGMFANVHRSLEELLLEERDSVAQLRFNSLYENLSETQQAVIKRKHHLRIIEKMRR